MSLEKRIELRKTICNEVSEILRKKGLIKGYYCRKCGQFHRKGSKVFDTHWEYQGMKVIG